MSHATTSEPSAPSAASTSPGADARAAGAQREPGGPQVLRLHREEVRDRARGLRPLVPAEQLRGGAAAAQLGGRHSATSSR